MKTHGMICIVLCTWIVGCKSLDQSQQKNLAFSTNVANYAVLIGEPLIGTANQLVGIDKDLINMKQAITGLNQRFTVSTLYDARKDDVIKGIAVAAKAVGANGTLFIYFSGHGDEDGPLVVRSNVGESSPYGTIDSKELAVTLGLARSLFASNPTPVKRIIFVIDSCYSGQWVDGRGEQFLNNFNDGFSTAYKIGASSLSGLYSQFLGFSASRIDQTSRVINGQVGSAFTSALVESLKSLSVNRQTKIVDLTNKTSATLKSMGVSQQPVVFALPSEVILNETLF